MTLVIINDTFTKMLNEVSYKLDDLKPLARSLADMLMSETQQNFMSQGRPTWQPLSIATIENYLRLGIHTNGILRRSKNSNSLYDSIKPYHTKDVAGLRTVKPYAATHQYGAKKGQYGKTKKGTPIPWGDVPARPYMPIDKNSHLQPEAEEALEDVLLAWVDRVFR